MWDQHVYVYVNRLPTIKARHSGIILDTVLKLSACALLACAAGCYMPMPDKVSAGHRFTKEEIALLDTPNTSRAEVIANLGPPLLESTNTHTLIYEWDQTVRGFALIPYGRTYFAYGGTSHWCL